MRAPIAWNLRKSSGVPATLSMRPTWLPGEVSSGISPESTGV
jgi:hypothetical protein